MRVAAVLTAALLAACSTTIPASGGSQVEWRQTVDLRMNQRAVIDGGGLELVLTGVGVNEATLLVDSREAPREERFRTGMAGARTYYPYRIMLLNTSIANTATVEVAKLR